MSETQNLSHDEVARDMIVRIQAIVAERFPVGSGLTAAQRRRLVTAAFVPDDFLEQIAVSVDTKPGVGELNDITSAESRDMIVYSRVFYAFADQIEQLGRGVRDAVTERRADVGQRALGVYATAKGINRPNRKLSIANVASLRRSLGHLGRGGRRKPAEGETPDPTPTEKK